MGRSDTACSVLYGQSASYFMNMSTALEHRGGNSAHTTVSHPPSKSVLPKSDRLRETLKHLHEETNEKVQHHENHPIKE